jgi:hypothetical protein
MTQPDRLGVSGLLRARRRRRPVHRFACRLERLDRRELLAVVVAPPSGILEGQPISGPIATLGTGDVTGAVGELQAVVAWGDGATSPATIAEVGESPGTLAVTVPAASAHAYAVNNIYTVTVTVVGTANTQAAGSGPITVGPTIPSGNGTLITAVAGRRFNGTVARFTDPNALEVPANYAAVVGWGDGTTSPGSVVADGPGQFRVVAQHVYASAPADAQLLTVTVTLAEDRVPTPLVLTGQASVGESSFGLSALPSVVAASAPFSDVVVATVKLDSAASADDFRVVLTPAGDLAGAPLLSASLRPHAGSNTTFDVVAQGQYADPGSNAATLTVVRISTDETLTAPVAIQAVAAGPVPITGVLAPFADTGVSNHDAITSTPFPVFLGTAPPYTVVLLYGRRLDSKNEVLLGRVMAGADGTWQLTVGPLPDGRYTIRALNAVPGADPEPHYLYPEVAPLTIDTIGLAVAKVERVRPSSLRVYFVPDAGGLDPATVYNPHNYSLVRGRRLGLPVATALTATPGPPTSEYLAVNLNMGRGTDRSASLSIAGLTDLAGNPLGGVFPLTTHAYPTRPRPYR